MPKARAAAPHNRSWPVPSRPWIMAQTWHDLLFMHWPIPIEQMRAVVPDILPLDTFADQAWIGVVPFRMSGIRARGLPLIPGTSAFLELNVRTYVTVDGKPGVYFFSLDAANRLAVWAARQTYFLPYYQAQMALAVRGTTIAYTSRRVHPFAPPAALIGEYAPQGEPFIAAPGSLDYWLTERYCLYSVDRRGRVYRGEIDHSPWSLQQATARIDVNTMVTPTGLELPAGAPRLHFSHRQQVRIWPLVRMG